MGNRERLAAAALFVVTGLALPVLFAMEKPAAPESSQVPYMLRQAFFELRMDMAMHHALTQSGQELPETEVEAETEGGIPALAFHVETWLAIGAEMEADGKARLFDGLAPLVAAMGRRVEGEQLLERASHRLSTDASWGCLLAPAGTASEELSVSECIASPGADLPEEAGPFAMALLGPDGVLQERASPEAVDPLLSPFILRVVWMILLGALLFVTGLVLLFLAPRLAKRYRILDYGLQGFRFSATPMATYLVFLAWFTLMITVHLMVAWGAQQLGLDLTLNRVAVTVTAYLLYAIAGLVLINRFGQPQVTPLTRAVDMQRADLTKRAVLFGAVAYCMALPVVLALTQLSAELFGTGPEVNPAIPQLLESDSLAERWGLILNICVIAPLFEEVFFRGFLFQQFKRFFSLPNAVALSAMIFASVHLSIESFLPLFGLGVLMALSYHLVQSLWASIVLHILWNSATVAVVLLLFT